MFNESDCLKYYPFDGDFGAPGDRTLSDRIVTARREGECHDCAQTIHRGERTRRLCAIFDKEMRSYRWCEACCCAMAGSWTDSGAALEARAALRHRMAES